MVSMLYYIAGAGALVLVAVYKVLQIGRRDPRMPPGPPTVPLLGNSHLLKSGLYKQCVLISNMW